VFYLTFCICDIPLHQYYNHLTQTSESCSAGVNPETPMKYSQLPISILDIMQEEQIDVSDQFVKLLSERMAKRTDKIYIMCAQKLCPDYLIQSPKVTYWNIEDPYKMDTNKLRKIRDQIKGKVKSIL
jgi:protein-tyrosine-phosphatase